MVARADRSGSELCFLEETVFPRHEGTSLFIFIVRMCSPCNPSVTLSVLSHVDSTAVR